MVNCGNAMTNIYVSGLDGNFTDSKLHHLGKRYGEISSCKAIMDSQGNSCRGSQLIIAGYGFIDYTSENGAKRAIQELTRLGYNAQLAYKQDKDKTNLYFSGLPAFYRDNDLINLVQNAGTTLSTRILYDNIGVSKRIGFARMNSTEECDKVIRELHGKSINDGDPPLIVKYADKNDSLKRTNSFSPVSVPIENYGYLFYPPDYNFWCPPYYQVPFYGDSNAGFYYPYVEDNSGADKTESESSQHDPSNYYYMFPVYYIDPAYINH